MRMHKTIEDTAELKSGISILVYDEELGVYRGSEYLKEERPRVIYASPVICNRAIRRKMIVRSMKGEEEL